MLHQTVGYSLIQVSKPREKKWKEKEGSTDTFLVKEDLMSQQSQSQAEGVMTHEEVTELDNLNDNEKTLSKI